MPLPDFKNEKEFREQWIGPFLSKMGFILPKHIHGPDEQGKDFFFMDHDRFGHLRFYAVQAKLGDIKVGKLSTDLLEQIQRCFDVTLKYHTGAHDQRIAAVYVMITGNFSPQAREHIAGVCRKENYGENVLFLDGEQLDHMERYATYQRDSNLRQRLLALHLESIFNLEPATKLVQSCSSGQQPVFLQCRTLAIEDGIRNPLPESIVDPAKLSLAWEWVSYINRRVVPINIVYDASSIATLVPIGMTIVQALEHIRDASEQGIRKLDERYSLSITVVPKGPQSQ